MNLAGLFSFATFQAAIGIFTLCLCSRAVDTLRLIFVVRGKKIATWVLGSLSSMIVVIALGVVMSELDNPLNAVGYAAGMATGAVFGMLFEQRLAIGHTHLTIYSASLGASIAEKLRDTGFAVTEVPARGRDGMVSMIWCDILRKDLVFAEGIVREIDGSAFITAEDIRLIQRGHWRK
jgi:uncharacterized protein YebE (UPF0316 family)